MNLTVTVEPARSERVEVVERKGRGHPDTMCDGLAEALSRALCRQYLAAFGAIQHHNVDKALIAAGASRPAFGGGRVTEPIDIYLAGRAASPGPYGEKLLKDIAVESTHAWLKENLHALDPKEHVRIHPILRPGSSELVGLYGDKTGAAPLANDTSFGVGYAPSSPLERFVLALDAQLFQAARAHRPSWGEDIKIMALRAGEDVELTIACALVDAHVESIGAYMSDKTALCGLAFELAKNFDLALRRVSVNAADRPREGALYLTVTGTSAEAGDDGQVGRGNRVNGLITPCRPMSLEAAAGKNPVSHVGKIYNVAAHEIAAEIAKALPQARRARCLLVSQIGEPISEPGLVSIALETDETASAEDFQSEIGAITRSVLNALPNRVDAYVRGGVALF
ncbi:MAG: S-adenosylmethionine synthetase [Alphaproteobacteria bacterium]|nr:MAG: S-adenosylmethionine synthetase [Alphaproteobacteria bacterium]